jgi:diacylglycerol O-acyltransferase / wax synthase
MELLSHLVDVERDAVDAPSIAPAPFGERVSRMDMLRDGLASATSASVRTLIGVPRTIAGTVASLARDPLGSSARAANTLQSIARTLAPATDPLSPIMRERGLGRRLDVFDVPLDDLKRAAKGSECSLNDAFVTAVAGGLARYHERHGHAVDELRMTMPINLRAGDEDSGGNHWAPARFPVPAGIGDADERMAGVRQLVRDWRTEPALALTGPLAGILNRLPTSMSTALFGSMLKGVDFVATNVPGAPVPVYAGGAAVERFYALAPPGGAAVNIALVSHVGHCCIGVVTDTAAVPDADLLLADLRAGFDEVVALG